MCPTPLLTYRPVHRYYTCAVTGSADNDDRLASKQASKRARARGHTSVDTSQGMLCTCACVYVYVCVCVCVYVCACVRSRTCTRACLWVYISREIRCSEASSRPDDGRTSSGPDNQTPLSAAGETRPLVGIEEIYSARAFAPTMAASTVTLPAMAGRPSAPHSDSRDGDVGRATSFMLRDAPFSMRPRRVASGRVANAGRSTLGAREQVDLHAYCRTG